jgi:hypothetical protein
MPDTCIGPLVPGERRRGSPHASRPGQEQDLVAPFDAQVGGFARGAHQRIHRLARAFDDLGAAQEGRSHAEGAPADVPKLARFLDLDHAVALQGHQRAVDRGHRLTAFGGKVRQRKARMLREDLQKAQGAVQRLDGVLVGLVGKGFRAPAGPRHPGLGGFGQSTVLLKFLR